MRARRFLLLIDSSTTYSTDNELGKALVLSLLRYLDASEAYGAMSVAGRAAGSFLYLTVVAKEHILYIVFHLLESGFSKPSGPKSVTFFSFTAPKTSEAPIMYPGKSLNIVLAFHSAFN